jgi:copper(I)-binding protein
VPRTTRRAVRLAVLPLVAVLGLATLTGCGAGIEAQTQQPYSPTIGTTTEIGPIHIANVVIVASVDGGLAEVYASFVNNSADEDSLTGIAVSDSGPVTLPDGPIPVPQYVNVVLGPGGTRVFVHDMKGKVGDVAKVTITMRDNGQATVDALITTEEGLSAGS